MTKRGLTLILIVVFVGLLALPHAHAVGKILDPTADPIAVQNDDAGNPIAFTVTVSGFPPGSQVWIEQCDGTPPGDARWSPSRNCDFGTSPAAAIVAADGTATFPTGDPNHVFRPIRGPSPQGQFNCLAPGEADPDNGGHSSTSCTLRVSSNNTAPTPDQVFRALRFTATGAAGTPRSASGSSSSAPILIAIAIVVAALAVAAWWYAAARRRRSVHSAR